MTNPQGPELVRECDAGEAQSVELKTAASVNRLVSDVDTWPVWRRRYIWPGRAANVQPGSYQTTLQTHRRGGLLDSPGRGLVNRRRLLSLPGAHFHDVKAR